MEVSDTSYVLDHDRKLPLYAKAGVRESWIVRLDEDQIEVYRDPAGERYRGVAVHGKDETIVPRFAPGLRLAARRSRAREALTGDRSVAASAPFSWLIAVPTP